MKNFQMKNILVLQDDGESLIMNNSLIIRNLSNILNGTMKYILIICYLLMVKLVYYKFIY